MGVVFVAFDIFFKVITVTSKKSLGHYLVSHTVFPGP